MPDMCKVGITDNLENRINSLTKHSGVPTRFQIYQTFSAPYIKNPEILEQEIFSHFSKERINRNREFIKIHPEKIISFIVNLSSVKYY